MQVPPRAFARKIAGVTEYSKRYKMPPARKQFRHEERTPWVAPDGVQVVQGTWDRAGPELTTRKSSTVPVPTSSPRLVK